MKGVSLTIPYPLWMLAVIPTSQTSLLGHGSDVRAGSQPSPPISPTALVQPAALAEEQTETQGTQTTETRVQNSAQGLAFKAASSDTSLFFSGLLACLEPSIPSTCL